MRGSRVLAVVALFIEAWGSPSFAQQAAKPLPPGFIKDADDLRGRIDRELKMTKPDFVVFVPKVQGATAVGPRRTTAGCVSRCGKVMRWTRADPRICTTRSPTTAVRS